MTRFPFMAALCATAIGVAGLASPAPANERDRPSFAMLDRDGSGEITQDEFQAAGQARFEARDANSDGVLDKDELMAAAAKRTEARIDRMMTRLDSNSDGALSAEEMAARLDGTRTLARLDTDGSGAVSEAEFDEARAKMQRRQAKRSQSD